MSKAALLRSARSGGRHLHLRTPAMRYAIASKLGEGTFATVHRCTDLATGDRHALKKIDKSLGEYYGYEDIRIEVMQFCNGDVLDDGIVFAVE